MRILIIEKDNKSAGTIKKGLEDMNFGVNVATEKEKIFSVARDSSVDLILFSSARPKSEENEILQALLETEIDVPILCFPAKQAQAGGKAPITSPEAILDLMGKFQATLRSEENSRGANIQFGPLVLDPVSHKVWRNQKEINLTPKEYTLLEFFIRHPNQILTRTMIANHVWNQNFDFFTNVIDVYINYLRRKLDQGYKTKLIHTVRGKGYILKEA